MIGTIRKESRTYSGVGGPETWRANGPVPVRGGGGTPAHAAVNQAARRTSSTADPKARPISRSRPTIGSPSRPSSSRVRARIRPGQRRRTARARREDASPEEAGDPPRDAEAPKGRRLSRGGGVGPAKPPPPRHDRQVRQPQAHGPAHVPPTPAQVADRQHDDPGH